MCPNPKLVQQVLGERTGFEETIPASARVCPPCYKAHLLIIKEGPKSIDQDLIQLITDLKRGISSSDTIKIKDDIVNKALHTLVIYHSSFSGSCVHEKHISGFNGKTPEAYFNEFYKHWQSISDQHLHWLDDIRKCIWDRIQFENEMIPSVESLFRHWKRACWVLDLWKQSDKNIMCPKPLSKYG